MKLQVHHIKFNSKYGTPEELEFSTPECAIKYFNNKGYGMHNWDITVMLDFGVETKISLDTFNDLTDYWE